MPQLDSFAFFSQVFWLYSVFFFLYFSILLFLFPKIYKLLKSRQYYLNELSVFDISNVNNKDNNDNLIIYFNLSKNVLVNFFTNLNEYLFKFISNYNDSLIFNSSILKNYLSQKQKLTTSFFFVNRVIYLGFIKNYFYTNLIVINKKKS